MCTILRSILQEAPKQVLETESEQDWMGRDIFRLRFGGQVALTSDQAAKAVGETLEEMHITIHVTTPRETRKYYALRGAVIETVEPSDVPGVWNYTGRSAGPVHIIESHW